MFKKIRRWLERRRWIGNITYWIRCHTWDKYHLINISGQEEGYKWGYIDYDLAMMLACFKLLCDFVENQSHYIAWEADEPHAEAKKEIDYLYNWWKNERPKRQKEVDQKYEKMSGLDGFDAKRKLYEEEDNNLIRLMKIRRFLWF